MKTPNDDNTNAGFNLVQDGDGNHVVMDPVYCFRLDVASRYDDNYWDNVVKGCDATREKPLFPRDVSDACHMCMRCVRDAFASIVPPCDMHNYDGLHSLLMTIRQSALSSVLSAAATRAHEAIKWLGQSGGHLDIHEFLDKCLIKHQKAMDAYSTALFELRRASSIIKGYVESMRRDNVAVFRYIESMRLRYVISENEKDIALYVICCL